MKRTFSPSLLLLILFLALGSLEAMAQLSHLVERDTFYIIGIQDQESRRRFLRKPLPLDANHGTIWVRTDQQIKLDAKSYYKLLYSFYGSGVWEITEPKEIPFDPSRMAQNYKVLESHSDDQYTKLIGHYRYKRVKIKDHAASQYSRPFKANVEVDLYMRKWVVEYVVIPFRPIEQSQPTDLPYNKKNYPLAYGYYLWRIVDILPVQ